MIPLLHPFAIWLQSYYFEVIANRIKPLLTKSISKEQFGFLFNQKILEVVGVAQEILRLIKVQTLMDLIMKMDLFKYYKVTRLLLDFLFFKHD